MAKKRFTKSARAKAAKSVKRALKKPTLRRTGSGMVEALPATVADAIPAAPSLAQLAALLGHFPSVGAAQPLPGLASVAAALAQALPSAGQLAEGVGMLATKLSAVMPSALATLQKIPLDTPPSMDPRLQLAIANRAVGKKPMSLASTSSDELAVVARVKSTEEWQNLSDVFPGAVLGKAADGPSWIVTGRVPIKRIEALRHEPTVASLKASQPVQPTLGATIASMGVASSALPRGTAPAGGKGVVVGIVDFGCDFVHWNFRLENGKTRLLALWDQSGSAMPGSPFGYGRLYRRDEIDAALATPNPYATLLYNPGASSHGTHVMDIAAGNGLGSGQPGVAPDAELVFVEVSATDVPWSGFETVNRSFGDSVQLLEAVRFVFDTAGDRPCVCNLSLGTNGGPHDGTSLVEQGLDAIVRERPNRAVVIAASNSQQDGIHASGTVAADATQDIVWRQRHSGGGEFELWYPGAARLEATLVAADGTLFGPVLPGDTLPIGSGNQIAIFISSRLADPNNGDNVIGVWVAPNLSPDAWTVRLRATDGSPVPYHAWIERNDNAQASFVQPIATHTLGSISCGRETIVVGSYDGHRAPQFPLSGFSSCGPTRDGRNKPEISAPGHNVIAANSLSLRGVTRMSGTSMAAPAISGLTALILAEARRRRQSLAIGPLRTKLLAGVQRNPPAGGAGAWDPRYGMGRGSGKAI